LKRGRGLAGHGFVLPRPAWPVKARPGCAGGGFAGPPSTGGRSCPRKIQMSVHQQFRCARLRTAATERFSLGVIARKSPWLRSYDPPPTNSRRDLLSKRPALLSLGAISTQAKRHSAMGPPPRRHCGRANGAPGRSPHRHRLLSPSLHAARKHVVTASQNRRRSR